MNLNETIFHKNHIIGVEELDPPFREVRFQHLMKEFCEDYTHYEADEFAVVWYEKDEDLYIEQIYNHDTGEIPYLLKKDPEFVQVIMEGLMLERSFWSQNMVVGEA